MSAAEASRLVTKEGATLIDVRPEEEYADGHPRGSLNVPYALSRKDDDGNGDFVAILKKLVPMDRVVICISGGGGISEKAAAMLKVVGYDRAAHVPEGVLGNPERKEPGWKALGLPLETDSADGDYPHMRWKAGFH